MLVRITFRPSQLSANPYFEVRKPSLRKESLQLVLLGPELTPLHPAAPQTEAALLPSILHFSTIAVVSFEFGCFVSDIIPKVPSKAVSVS